MTKRKIGLILAGLTLITASCNTSSTCSLFAQIFGSSASGSATCDTAGTDGGVGGGVAGMGGGGAAGGATSMGGSAGGTAGTTAGAGGSAAGAMGSAGMAGAGTAGAGGGSAGSVGGSTGAGGAAGSAGGNGGAIAVTTQLGWLPCAPRGTTALPETCALPAGATKVLYGDVPETTGHNLTKFFAAGSSFVVANASFSSAENPGGQPNPSCSSCDAFAWYEALTSGRSPTGTITGPAITVPLFAVDFPGYTQSRIRATNQFDVAPNPGAGGAFRDPCYHAKFMFGNPIDGESYLYDYVGNTAVTLSSTALSIRTSGASTCGGGTLNRSSYIFPAMINTVTHAPVRPIFTNIYYKNDGVPAQHPVPTGLVMANGDPDNSTPGANPARYACVSDSFASAFQSNIPTCPMGTNLIAAFSFKQCWDGVHTDSADHRSHMGDPVNGACPAAFPVGIPLVSYNVRWPVTSTSGVVDQYRLSSDSYATSGPISPTASNTLVGFNGGYSGHAYYVYGWDDSIMSSLATNCWIPGTDCHDYLTGDGRIMF